MRIRKRHELLGLVIWCIVASFASLIFNAEIYGSLLLFFGLPSIYLSYRYPQHIRKSAVFSLLISIPFAFLFDYVMESTGGWTLGRMALPNIWIIGHVSLFQIIWLFTYSFFILMYYLVFYKSSRRGALYQKRFPYFVAAMLIILLAVIFGHFFFPELLYIHYFYLKAGIVVILLPTLAILGSHPALDKKMLKVGAFFLYYCLVYEVTALKLDQWSFPAHNEFIGLIHFHGYAFPLEELLFWIMLGAIAGLSYYEYFDDNCK